MKQQQKLPVTQANKTTATLYGLIDSQRHLHEELEQHLLETTRSDLTPTFIVSMNDYWTPQDEIMTFLTSILRDPVKWFDLDEVNDLLVNIIHFLALMDKDEVDEIVVSINEAYFNKSEPHTLLCQDFVYLLLLFRRMLGHDANYRSNGTNFQVQLRITVDTLDLAGHWWSTVLCEYAEMTFMAVRSIIYDTAFGRHYVNTISGADLVRTMDFFEYNAKEVVPGMQVWLSPPQPFIPILWTRTLI